MKSDILCCCLATVTVLSMSTFHLYRSVEKTQVIREVAPKALRKVNTTYPFPVLSYPMEIHDISKFVEKLLTGRKANIPEINPGFTNIQFTANSRRKCEDDLDIVILVKSVVFNHADRDFQRKTFAHLEYLSKFQERIQVAFLVGNPEDPMDRDRLQVEMNYHKDMVQGVYVDTNMDSTVKTMVGLSWAKKFCANFKFLVFVNSGVYFSIENLIKFLRDPHFYPTKRKRSILMKNSNPLSLDKLSKTDFFAGSVAGHANVVPGRTEDDGGTIILTPEDYPPPFFPTHVRHPLQILSLTTANKFYYLAPFVKHLYVDEIYLGLLANKLKILPVNTVYVEDQEFVHLSGNITGLNSRKHFICLYNVLPDERSELWYHFNPIM